MRASNTRWLRPVAVVALAALAMGIVPDPGAARAAGRRVVVLGFDGMDYTFTRELMAAGEMPNFERLIARGTAQPLGTSVPPLSPVAWSTFITGMDPSGHGIFDFIHRDPETLFPYLSTSAPEETGDPVKIGKYQFALSGGGYELLRKGTPFWEVLEERGVETTVIRMPANFPPSGTATRELSGMGTPDVLGSYGTFTFYSSDIFLEERNVAGGEIRPLDLWNGVAEGTLTGPDNPMLVKPTKLTSDFTLYVDDRADVARLVVGDTERVLEIGEWTEWIDVDFELLPPLFGFLPLAPNLTAMARFYLRQVRPEVELYVSPLNFDPYRGDLPISTPEEFAAELAEISGRFYTQGMPEDTQALKGDVLTPAEFLQQAKIAGDEVEAQFLPVLERYSDGLLFYYFGNMDLVSHMMWHVMDPGHPAFDEAKWGPYREAVRELYRTADRIVGRTLDSIDDDTTLIVMSDHGFASWRRTFSINAWLRDNGYLTLKKPGKKKASILSDVDWSRTRAYGIGLNGLYVNLRGREGKGIVDPARKQALVEEIRRKLLAEVDPLTGAPAITKVYVTATDFEAGPYLEIGPDVVIGYAKGTRGESDSALGEINADVYTDNTDDWGADHGMDHETVPGIFFSNRPLAKRVTGLKDLAAAILGEFGIDGFPRAADSS